MSLQFDRIVKVHVANILIEELRIDFDIEYTADGEQDTGELTIYNLKRSTFEQIKDKGERVVIEAGYREAGSQVIYDGVAQRIWKTRGETSFQCKVQLGDTLHSDRVKGGITEHTFQGVVPTRDIAQRLVRDLRMEIGPLDAIHPNDTRNNFTATGKTTNSLDKLVAETPKLGWMASGNTIRFTSGANSQSDGVRINLSAKTGMVGIPEIEEGNTSGRRMSVTMLLDPRAKPGGEVVIKDSEYIEPTPYTIVGVQHIGGNWSTRFLTLIDAVSPDYDPNPPQNETEVTQ